MRVFLLFFFLISFCLYKRQFALHARNYSVSEAMSGNRMLVRPFFCGNICVCCDPCCPKTKIDAAEYYTSEERQLAAFVEEEKLKVTNSLNIFEIYIYILGRSHRLLNDLLEWLS